MSIPESSPFRNIFYEYSTTAFLMYAAFYMAVLFGLGLRRIVRKDL
ncbi:hypothetical protein [Paenibacillus sp. FSL L8-0158]